jgi:hypothetical protein
MNTHRTKQNGKREPESRSGRGKTSARSAANGRGRSAMTYRQIDNWNKSIESERDRLREQRDELLAALKNLAQTTECEPYGSPNVSAAMQEAYAAIERAEGMS